MFSLTLAERVYVILVYIPYASQIKLSLQPILNSNDSSKVH